MIPRTSKKLFDLFYRGDFVAALDAFESQEVGDRTEDEIHMAFASLAILGRDLEGLSRLIPKPISKEAFWDELRSQIEIEIGALETGLLFQPTATNKASLVAGIGLEAGKKYFVETGTYTGQSLLRISGLFEKLWSVEASDQLHLAAKALFEKARISNVTLHLGNSLGFLDSFSTELGNNAIFFLDAHYSQGITSRKYGRCPVIAEISTILANCPESLIVVDDLRTMNGKKGYPTLEDILGSLPRWTKVEIMFDQLIISSNDKF